MQWCPAILIRGMCMCKKAGRGRGSER
jgi:hypothetical protein